MGTVRPDADVDLVQCALERVQTGYDALGHAAAAAMDAGNFTLAGACFELRASFVAAINDFCGYQAL